MHLHYRVLGLVVAAALVAAPGAAPSHGSRSVNTVGLGSENGHAAKSHAPDNAERGTNRVLPEGAWKTPGHDPSDNSDPQGASPSNPDAGGLDKPGGAQGSPGDQDGNNGCGNDLDREDDNNGWCGRPPAAPSPAPSVPPSPGSSPTPSPAPSLPPILPEIGPTSSVGGGSSVVLPRRVSASEGLARTGVDIALLLALSLGFAGAGALLRRRIDRR